MGIFGNLFSKGQTDITKTNQLRREVIEDFAKEAKASQEYWSPFVSKNYEALSAEDRAKVDQEVKVRLKGH